MPLRAPAQRSTLVLTLVALTIVATCLRLSWWQWERAQWKRSLQDAWAARARAPAVALGADFRYDEPLRFRVATAAGRYETGSQIYLDNQVRDGRPGVLVVTPLRLTGSDARVLVVRGWLPWSSDRARLPRVPVPEGPLEVSGTLDTWPGQAALPGAAPAEAFAGDTWPWLDAAALARRVGGVVHGFVLREGGADEGPLQRAPAVFEDKRGMHIGYAIQWAAFAVIALLVYLRLLRGQAAARGDEQEGRV